MKYYLVKFNGDPQAISGDCADCEGYTELTKEDINEIVDKLEREYSAGYDDGYIDLDGEGKENELSRKIKKTLEEK